jgi:uncharacterized protein YkwD
MKHLAIFALAGALLAAGCAGPLTGTHQATLAPVDQASAQALISQHRRAHGLGALAPDPALRRMAEAQARSMASFGGISHGPEPFSRRLTRYGGQVGGAENVSAGYATLERVMTSWRSSHGHNQNLLLPGARRFGIALAHAPNTRYRTYWALVIAE